MIDIVQYDMDEPFAVAVNSRIGSSDVAASRFTFPRLEMSVR